MTYWKFGLKSVYTFDAAGHVKTLTARNTMYTFDLDVPSRMLVTSSDDAIEDAPDFEADAEIGCSTCEVTWNTLCDVGLAEVCYLDENNPVGFDDDAEDSVRRFCSAIGAACETSAFATCDGQCAEGDRDTLCCISCNTFQRRSTIEVYVTVYEAPRLRSSIAHRKTDVSKIKFYPDEQSDVPSKHK